ncbi:dual specificity protein phosphatase family protein [Wenxinia marina]|nr:dual specificity protein phosphatase family protein [Wenxinia marina]GGL79303.1 protein-tyrosine-phosphatase [Wenxinia marina]
MSPAPPKAAPEAPTLIDRIRFQLRDYAVLRLFWHNFGRVSDGVYRSNHPTLPRLRRYLRDHGIRSVVNLRGPHESDPYYRMLRHACAEAGLTLHDVKLLPRAAASRAQILQVIETFRQVEKPFLMHCKSGADRAGMAAALYRLAIDGATVEEARRELSLRYLHIRRASTGILDHILDVYAARLADKGPIGIEEWIRTEYDPQEVTRSYLATRGRT